VTPTLLIWMHFRAGYLDLGVPLLAKRWLRACYIVTIIFWPIRSLRSYVILVRLFGSYVISSRSIVVLCHIACLNFKGDELHLGLVSSGVHHNPSVDELWLCLVLYIFLGQGCASYFIYIYRVWSSISDSESYWFSNFKRRCCKITVFCWACLSFCSLVLRVSILDCRSGIVTIGLDFFFLLRILDRLWCF